MKNIKLEIRDGVQAKYEVFTFTDGTPDADRPMGSGESPDEALGNALRELDLGGSFGIRPAHPAVITLEIEYKHDGNAELTEECWVFTQEDLVNPYACDRDDIFIANGPGLPEEGVFVQRNGEVTNLYGNGTAGVTDGHRELADGIGEYVLDGKLADTWRRVMVNDRGRFECWADTDVEQTTNGETK